MTKIQFKLVLKEVVVEFTKSCNWDLQKKRVLALVTAGFVDSTNVIRAASFIPPSLRPYFSLLWLYS